MEFFMKNRKSGLAVLEHGYFTEKYTVIKYRDADKVLEKRPYDILENICEKGINCLLDAGITLAWNLIIGASASHYSAPQIGVGDSSTAAVHTQDALLGGSQIYVAMEGGFPSVAGAIVTFQGQFGDGVAEWNWLECAVRQAGAATTLLNRVVADKGTKAAGEVWSAKLQITLS